MKFAKPGILYVAGVEKLRANDCSTMVISAAAAITKPCPGRHLARFCPSTRQGVRWWAHRKRARCGNTEASLCMSLRFVSHLKKSLSIASRGARQSETFPKTAIYCHLLPFWSRKVAGPDTTVSSPTWPRWRAGTSH